MVSKSAAASLIKTQIFMVHGLGMVLLRIIMSRLLAGRCPVLFTAVIPIPALLRITKLALVAPILLLEVMSVAVAPELEETPRITMLLLAVALLVIIRAVKFMAVLLIWMVVVPVMLRTIRLPLVVQVRLGHHRIVIEILYLEVALMETLLKMKLLSILILAVQFMAVFMAAMPKVQPVLRAVIRYRKGTA